MEARKLVEAYQKKLAVAEQVYTANTGKKMSAQSKEVTAALLENVNRFINEQYMDAAIGTQRQDLGRFKTMCMNITTVTMPNLIVNDIFMVHPLTSITGWLVYMEYALGTEKGGVGGFAPAGEDGYADGYRTLIANPFMNGQMTADRVRYTSRDVVEAIGSEMAKVSFRPVLPGTLRFLDAAGNDIEGEFELANWTTGELGEVPAGAVKVAYSYDNVVTPQEKLPTVVGHMRGIALEAKARRIAVFYNQIAEFQAKTDYDIDFSAQIEQQAQAELSYEIDTEAVQLVADAADKHAPVVTWVDEELDTLGYSVKAEGFLRAINKAKMNMYQATRKHQPNWMVVSPDVMTILEFVKGFQPASNNIINGPYLAGSVAGMKVYVSPALEGKVCYLGVLGGDGKTATGVFAPYMPIMPTQLLQFADGGMSKGWSTMYDMKIINPILLSKIVVLDGDNAAEVCVKEHGSDLI